ncbi:MAG: nucleotidyltransferase domain-containing protein [Pseudomonadota bacterium]
MKENLVEPKEWSDNQRRIFIDAAQLYEAFIVAFRDGRSYRGGMHWKKSKGKDYLFRSTDRLGYGKSMGPRSPETEKTLEDFRKGKERSKERMASLKQRINEQSRFCKAAAIQRVPKIVTSVLRLLDQHKLLGSSMSVIGTNAIYAYEAASGVFVDRPILATRDMDILWDIRSRLKLVADSDRPVVTGLLDILRKADKSFERHSGQHFRAVNNDGYLVDLVKPEPKPAMMVERRRVGEDDDLDAAEIGNLQWLVSSPKFEQVVVGEDGYAAKMVCPDPRSFALHKIWLSGRSDRDPVKKKRDRHQGLTVAYLVARYLPGFSFSADELRMFPMDVFEAANAALSEVTLPKDLR